MRVVSLQSGSNGNCIHVESGEVRLLVDAGISGKQAELRLASAGGEIRNCDAVLISHDHADHVRCAGVFSRKFGLPIYATEKTFDAADRRCRLGRIGEVHRFRAGRTMSFGHVTVETVPTAHDGVEGVAFVIDDGASRLGVLTDLGHVFDGLVDVIASLDAVVLESNYDPHMLETGPYPSFLKARITGSGGHISNVESAELLATGRTERLRWACLGHLSGDNNTPELARAAHEDIWARQFDLHVASRHEPLVLPEL